MNIIAKPSDWDIKPLPEDLFSIKCNIEYTDSQLNIITQGIIPEEMEEKWFMYFKNSNLYIYISWTGICLFIAKFNNNSISEIMVNSDKDFNLPKLEEIPLFVDKLIQNLILDK